jgi:hypothetical protein
VLGDVEAPIFSIQSAHRWNWGCRPYGRPLTSGKFLVLIFVRGLVDPRAIVRLEGLGRFEKYSNLPACSIVLVPTMLPRVTSGIWSNHSSQNAEHRETTYFTYAHSFKHAWLICRLKMRVIVRTMQAVRRLIHQKRKSLSFLTLNLRLCENSFLYTHTQIYEVGFIKIFINFKCQAVPYLRRLVAVFQPRRPGFKPRSGGICGEKLALGQVFSKYFGFPHQFSFHWLLHHLSYWAGIIGQLVADIPSGLSLTPPQETTKKKKVNSVATDSKLISKGVVL